MISWINKYKPMTFEEYNYHLDIISIFDNNLENIQNMLFYGNAGTGKTTFSNIIVNMIYKNNEDLIKNNVLKLNASDERGINIVKTKIQEFCKKQNYGGVKFKFLILDEADAITYEAQTALRKIMEIYPNTKFCLICNYEDKIINPIQSRCLKLYFKPITEEFIGQFLENILRKENIFNDKSFGLINFIIKITNGDIRKSIILLESLNGINDIDEEKLKTILGIIDIKEIEEMIDNLTYDNLRQTVTNIMRKSYQLKKLLDIIKQIVLKRNIKGILIKLSKYDNLIFYNVDSEIILINIFTDFLL